MGEFPILLLAGKSGITLFPAETTDKEQDATSKNVKIDPFAFNVSKDNFEKAKKSYTELSLDFTIRDHHYFHSIYTKDPDEHTVELTTIVMDENKFYR